MSGDLAVQYSKLPEWLLARRLIPEDYGRLQLAVEAKVTEALLERVSDEVALGLIEEHKESMHYFAAKDVYEAVAKSPEGQLKTLLGAHSHPGAAKWKAVLDAYRRRHLSWVSGARLLIQNVSYEIPALKKHAATCERQVADGMQRQSELLRVEANSKTRYEEMLKELGIEGFDPSKELRASAAQELPKLHAEVVMLLQRHGEELVSYYGAFAKHAAGGQLPPGHLTLPIIAAVARGSDRPPTAEEVELEVPALRALREKSARTAALTSTSRASDISVFEPQREVDWGATLSVSEPLCEGGGINWDFDSLGAGGAVASRADIDWGMEVSTGGEEASATLPTAEAAGGIDWSAISFDGLEISAADGTGEASHSGDEGREGLLRDLEAREMLYQEVVEVASFLQARCDELSSTSSEDFGPKSEQRSLQEVKVLKDVTNQAEELLAGRRTQRLLLLRSSDRYLAQQVRRLELAKAQCGKPAVQRGALNKANADQVVEVNRTRAEVDKLRAATHKVQRALEAELCAHFKSSVRIVGDIASI